MFTSSFNPGELQGTGGKGKGTPRKNKMTQHISMSLFWALSDMFCLFWLHASLSHVISHFSFFHISVIFAPLYLLHCLNSALSDNAGWALSIHHGRSSAKRRSSLKTVFVQVAPWRHSYMRGIKQKEINLNSVWRHSRVSWCECRWPKE